MLFFLGKGYRVIAHDRRGYGRSTQFGDGHDMDHYADDLAAVTVHLDLKNVIHVGHSTGGGEVIHYLARHGESRVAKAAIISAVPPLMVKTAANPGGLPKDVFDGFQAQLAANRSEFYHAIAAGPFPARHADNRGRNHQRRSPGLHRELNEKTPTWSEHEMGNSKGGLLSRRRLCLCCIGAGSSAAVGGWLTPREAFAEARGIVSLIKDSAAVSPIVTHKLRNNVTVLEGSGGSVAVLSGPDGKVLIDAGLPFRAHK
jgi:hypothetical protein